MTSVSFEEVSDDENWELRLLYAYLSRRGSLHEGRQYRRTHGRRENKVSQVE